MVELLSFLHQVAEDADQVSSNRAADTAIIHFQNLFVSIDNTAIFK
jgi:hypothetical protein